MIEGKRPEQVMVKSDSQTVVCPECGKSFTVPAGTYKAKCLHCGQLVNWGMGSHS